MPRLAVCHRRNRDIHVSDALLKPEGGELARFGKDFLVLFAESRIFAREDGEVHSRMMPLSMANLAVKKPYAKTKVMSRNHQTIAELSASR